MTVRDVAKTLVEEFVQAVSQEENADADAIQELLQKMNEAFTDYEKGLAEVRDMQLEAAEKYKESLRMQDANLKIYSGRMDILRSNLIKYKATKEHKVIALEKNTLKALPTK